MVIYNPEKKLELLRKYMDYFVNHWGDPTFTGFDKYLRTRFPSRVYNTPAYWQDHATHCFYCGIKFINGNATVDHFFPTSKDISKNKEYKLFVICCVKCNTHKGNLHPVDFIKKFTRLNKIGLGIKKFKPEAIKTICESVNSIHNDILLGRKKFIYYIYDKQALPKDFIKI